MKETRFFLDANYPLVSEKRFDRDDMDSYFSFFDRENRKADGAWCLEATPDYLYSSNTARLIRENLRNVRLIFFLREPITRLLSFYQFGLAMGEVPRNMTLDEFVQKQKVGEGAQKVQKHPVFCALPHGRYSVYLEPFVKLFERASIHVACYDDLCGNPLEFMKAVCRFAEIDEGYFENFLFTIANKGVSVRSPFLHNAYWRAKEKIRLYLRTAPKRRSRLRPIRASIDTLYQQTNVKPRAKISMSEATEAFLRDYYREEPTRLQDVLGREIRWATSHPAAVLKKARGIESATFLSDQFSRK